MKKLSFRPLLRCFIALILCLQLTVFSTSAIGLAAAGLFLAKAAGAVTAAVVTIASGVSSVDYLGTKLGFWGGENNDVWYTGGLDGYLQQIQIEDPDLLTKFLNEECPGWTDMTEEEFIDSGYYVKLLNIASYNKGYQADEETVVVDGYTGDDYVHEYFNQWRAIDRGTQDFRYTGSINSEREQTYLANSENEFAYPQFMLVNSNNLALSVDARNDESYNADNYEGMAKYYYNYFASNIFSVAQETDFLFSFVQNSIKSSKYGDYFGSFPQVSWSISLFEYSEESFVGDNDFLNILNNWRWDNVYDFTSSSITYTLDQDKNYVLIARAFFYPNFVDNTTYRFYDYFYTDSPTFTVVMDENWKVNPATPTSSTYTNYISNSYVSTYYDNSSNWYGDQNNDYGDGDGSGGSGSGSGDGSLSGDLNLGGSVDVNVDGELDLNVDGSVDVNVDVSGDVTVDHNHGGVVEHSHDGEVDVNVNINGDGFDYESTGKNIVLLIIDSFLDFILDCFTSLTSPILDLLKSFTESIIEKFQSLLDTEYSTFIKRSFSAFPDPIQDFFLVIFYLSGFILIRKLLKG